MARLTAFIAPRWVALHSVWLCATLLACGNAASSSGPQEGGVPSSRGPDASGDVQTSSGSSSSGVTPPSGGGSGGPTGIFGTCGCIGCPVYVGPSGSSGSSGGASSSGTSSSGSSSSGSSAWSGDGGNDGGNHCSGSPCPVTLASGQENPGDLAVDSTSVYWTTAGRCAGSCGDTGTVMKVALGGGSPVTLASGEMRPGNITVDATNAYWTSADCRWLSVEETTLPPSTPNGAVMTVPIAGGMPIVLASGQSATGLALDGANIYWTNSWGGASGGGR